MMPVYIYRRLQKKFNPTQPNISTHQWSGRTAQIWKRNGASCSRASCSASCRARDRRQGRLNPTTHHV